MTSDCKDIGIIQNQCLLQELSFFEKGYVLKKQVISKQKVLYKSQSYKLGMINY